MPKIAPVQGTPALLIGGKRSALCVADLHLGYEIELREAGFNIPDQTDELISSLVSIEQGDSLILLGDLKHTIPKTTGQELMIFNRFFKAVSERFESVRFAIGNHDGMIDRALPENVEIADPQGFRLDDVGFVHGHSWPSEEVMGGNTLVWGHLHPCVRLRDRLGASTSFKCWLKGKVHKEAIAKRYETARVKDTIVMPSFNHLLTGMPVNEKSGRGLSPLTRSGFVVLDELRAYTLDGVDMGTVESLHANRQKVPLR